MSFHIKNLYSCDLQSSIELQAQNDQLANELASRILEKKDEEIMHCRGPDFLK